MSTVSIIIPSYNHAIYVEKTILSVFQQTYSNIEIIIVDDGSTDDSVSIIQNLLKSSPFPSQLIIQKNQGGHAAINHGIRKSSGNFINILNSDDYFSPDRIEIMLEQHFKSKSEFLFSRVAFVDNLSIDITQKYPYARDISEKQDRIKSFPSTGYALLDSNVTVSTGNFFFTRQLFEKVGEFKWYRYCHDWDFVLRTLNFTEPLFVDQTNYFYRLHQNNSFKSLADAAAYECPALMRNYFKTVQFRRTPNPIAPNSWNWPYYFDYFVRKTGLEYFLRSAND